MFKRKELAEIPNVKPIAAETKKQRAKEGKQRSKQLRRSAKQSEMNAAQSARSIKKRRAPEKAADCLQYERMYESGICEVEPGLFSMTMAFTDVNFQLARQEEQKSLFTQYSEFLNYFDPDTHLQISLVTRRVDEAEFRRDTFLPLRGDARDRYSEEMNRVISEKALQGQNGLIREKYITISLHEDDYRKAQVRLLKRAEDIQNLFKRMGSTVRRLSGIERLNLLHGITRPEEVMAFSYDWLLAEDSLTTKDFIAPSGYNWKPEHDDSRAVYNDRYQFGEYYGKVLYLRDIAPQMKDNLLSLLSDLDFDNAISIHVDAVEQREAVEQVQKQLAYMQKEKGDGMVNAVRMNLPAYMGVRYELTNQIEDAEELLDNLHNYNQKIFKVCILIHTYGRNNAELDERVQQICNTVQQQTCRFSPIPFEQCAAMNSVLPLGKKWLALERTLLTVNTAIYVPFTTQELFQPGGLYEGTNARSKNLIMVNRKLLPAPAGMVLGMTGFGKSFAVMQMMAGIMLRWPEDDLVIIDPENEYARLVDAFGGEVIEISASSKSHINPMDISEDYGDEGNPIQLKSQFLRDFCQLVLNSKELSAQECSLVDRAALITYQKYLLHPEREQMPSLHDFYNNLSLQGPQAKALTMALSMYVDGTMDLFAHQTNVHLQNHCICFNTVKLGKSMQSIGMMTVLDQIWNRITRNRVLGRRTWIFTDEFQLLLGNSACTNYYFELSSRARKWGAILTSITQHVRSVLNNEDARRMLSDCGYDKTANGGKNMRLICARSKMFKKKDAARALNGIPCPAPYASEWKLELMAREVFRTVWKENAEDILGLLRMLDANLNTTGTPNDGNQLENKLSALNEELDDLVSQRASRSITMDDFLSRSTEINNEIINVESLLQSSIQEQRPKARLDMHSIEAALSDDASFPDGKIEPGFLDRYANRIVKSNNRYIWMLQLMNVQQIMPIQSERQPIAMVTYKSGVPYDIEQEQIDKQDKESAGLDCATICRPQDFFLNMGRTTRKRKLVEWLESCQENQVSVLDEKIPLLSFAVDFVTAYEYQKARGIKIHPGLWKDMRVDIFLVKKEN